MALLFLFGLFGLFGSSVSSVSVRVVDRVGMSASARSRLVSDGVPA
jgi:hypothetical protein